VYNKKLVRLLLSRTQRAVTERRSASGVPKRAAAPLHMAGLTPQVHVLSFMTDHTAGTARQQRIASPCSVLCTL